MPTLSLTDTHCHLYVDFFIRPKASEGGSDADREEAETVKSAMSAESPEAAKPAEPALPPEPAAPFLARAVEAGVDRILLPAIDLDSMEQMDRLLETAHRLQPGLVLRPMAGIHPCEVKPGSRPPEQALADAVFSDRVIGVGETGLDGYWSREAMREQEVSLRLHCRLARESGKPIVLHNRETTDELLRIIEQEQDGRLRGVWHCFNGTVEQGRRAIDLGLHLGIGGVLTYPRSGVSEVVAQLPPERMVLETDAPYLAPVPHRGKRNEPSYLLHTATHLAGVLDVPLAELAALTTRTALELFPEPPAG